MKNIKKSLSVFKLSLLAAIALLSHSVFAASTSIDVAFVIDESIIQSQSREWVDNHIDTAITVSNQTLTDAGLAYTRNVKMVYTATSDNAVSVATLGSNGALDGVHEACEVVKDTEYEHYDNVVWLVPATGNSNRTGNASNCVDTDHYVAVIAIGTTANLGYVIAHEMGHFDNLTHASADQYYADTGKVLLMSSHLSEGLTSVSELLTAGDITNMQTAAAVADQWPKYFDQPRTEGSASIGTATMVPMATDVNVESGEVSFQFSLDSALAEDVSVEFYTHGIEAQTGVDYEETVSRVTLLAGATEAEVDVPLIVDATRYVDKTFEVGVRYGDKVDADSSLIVTLTANSTSDTGTDTGDNTGDSGSSGGGSMNLFYLVALLVCSLIRRIKQ